MPGEKVRLRVLTPGHRACQGCGQALGVRLALERVEFPFIVANATGCLEVFSTAYPYSSWAVPWIHSLFENTAAVASGISAALRALGRGEVRVVALGGDGGTADIGLQALSGMFERGDDVLYICYDNEAYMNTGVQRSGLTPPYARTSTSPVGKVKLGNLRPKKDMLSIAIAHGVGYAATASVGYPKDLERKVQKAMGRKGPRYLHIHAPCPLGWGFDPEKTVEIAQLAVQTGLFPLVEIEDGVVTGVRKLPKRLPVEEYLKHQSRFAHLFTSEEGRRAIAEIQAIADANVARYGL
mgnify:CR=1 FL=1